MNVKPMRATATVLALSLAASVLLLAATAGFLRITAARIASSQNQYIHTADVINTARSVIVAVDDAEAGQRGLVLTNDRSYLDPYVRGVDALPAILARLRDLTAGDPIQQARFVELQKAVASKVAELGQSIEIFETSGSDAARTVIKTQSGRDSIIEIRNLADAIIGTENGTFAVHVRRAAAVQRREEMIIVLVVGGALATLMAAAGALFAAVRRSYRSQRVLQATVNGVARGVAAFEKGRLVARNDSFMELLGIPPELGTIGTPAARMEQAETGGLLIDLTEQMNRARDTNRGFMIERNRPDGAIFQLYFSPPLDGIAVFGAYDATVHHHSERFLQNAQKMDALGHLTGGIAHDFNNLLTVILMNLDVMRKDPIVMEKFGRRVELMGAASLKGATLVRQLLAYAKKQPLEPEVVDLTDLMPGLVDLIKRTIGENIDVAISVGAKIWPTIVDPAQFESTALNLALNARDAMPDGGSLVLELANTTLDEAYAMQHGEVTPGDYVLFAVSDSGSGMTAEVLSHAFDPFFTTKGDGRGNGLGLSMVYGFVKQIGGHIKIYSEPGKGTTVKLYFPRCREEATSTPSSPNMAAPTGTETILVVEDDDKLRSTMVGVLKDLGYNTLQAANGQSALTVLQREKPVDLLFTDMVLSGSVSGRKLAETARELQPTIKVLYTSGYTEQAEQHHGQSDPSIGLLRKPYCTDELAMKLRHVMSRKAG